MAGQPHSADQDDVRRQGAGKNSFARWAHISGSAARRGIGFAISIPMAGWTCVDVIRKSSGVLAKLAKWVGWVFIVCLANQKKGMKIKSKSLVRP
jgi:hypothetical protein